MDRLENTSASGEQITCLKTWPTWLCFFLLDNLSRHAVIAFSYN